MYLMTKEIRIVKYDTELRVEAYHFQGIMQKFPNHFHEYYVLGFIEEGNRFLSCKNREYTVVPGDLVLFNPGDNHTCEQVDGKTLDYRCINIQPEVMAKAVLEITGKEKLPHFTTTVVFRSEFSSQIKELHSIIMEEERDFRKEELFLLLLEQLMAEHTAEVPSAKLEQSSQVMTVCSFLERNYRESITLDQLSDIAGLSKYYLLRSFTKQMGISPYRYLETIRVDKAKKLLEQGVLPIDAALQTGFSDQSHFSNFFKKLIGLTPKQYQGIYKTQL